MRFVLPLLVVVVLSACTTGGGIPVSGPLPGTAPPAVDAPQTARASARANDSFAQVKRRVEPVAESLCERETTNMNCDYRIELDTSPGAPANAFQTVDRTGRPVIIVTSALLDDLQNAHETAFVLGHEAAHHIAGHIPRTQTNSVLGALAAGEVARVLGATNAQIANAQEMGAFAGGRQFSKQFELEADSLGTVIAQNSGYDPVLGVAYFQRIPDPGDRFLGSHPPNADRIDVVRKTAATLR